MLIIRNLNLISVISWTYLISPRDLNLVNCKEREKMATSGGRSLQFPNEFSGKLLFHLIFNPNFWIFCINGKHQESITRSMQLPGHIPVTAFSRTDLFLI